MASKTVFLLLAVLMAAQLHQTSALFFFYPRNSRTAAASNSASPATASAVSNPADVVGSVNYTNGNGQNDSVIVLSIGKDITNMISKAPPTDPTTTAPTTTTTESTAST